jgi:phosphoribulokinase
MSVKHPVIAVTGSSGAGTSTVKTSFEHIFHRENVRAAVIEGDSFHRYEREEMKQAIAEAEGRGERTVSHFGPRANLFGELEALFRSYGDSGTGKRRFYVHNEEEAARLGHEPGTFTPWEELPDDTDVLFYEGLHGGVRAEGVNVARYVDLLIGVVPIVNLEWIQKIHRDTRARGYSVEAATDTILRRMHDYVHYITPQFSHTHGNFQRVPVVDTSNPFVARDIPTLDESLVVVRFRDPTGVDFPYLLRMIHDSFMSRPNCIVVPGGKMEMAIQLVVTPLLQSIMERRKSAKQADGHY